MKRKLLFVILFGSFISIPQLYDASFLRGLDKYFPEASENKANTCWACLAKMGTRLLELGKDWHDFLRASDPR